MRDKLSPWFFVFRLDLRWLAVGRIALGLVIFFDFLQALSWRNEFYSERGVLTRVDFADLTSLATTWSPYFLMSHPQFTNLLLAASLLVAFAFTVGWQTKWTTPLLWLAVVSLQERNPWILIGGDAWLRATLFWLMFLPVGEYFALTRERKGEPLRDTVANAASIGLILQVVYLYLWAGVAKYGQAYQEGSTIYYVLSGPEFGEERARWLLYFPDLLKIISQSIPYWEIVACLCLIVPYKTHRFRRVGVMALFLLHVGIWYCMDLYHFSAVALSTLVLLWLPNSREPRWVPPYLNRSVSVLLLVWCFAVLIYNPVRIYCQEQMPWKARIVAEAFGLEQIWQLFAPTAPTSSFLVYPVAVMKNGEQQYLGFRGEKRDRQPEMNDPEFHVRLSRYWRSLSELPASTKAFHSYASWYARRFSELYPLEKEDLYSIRLYYRTYQVLPDYEDSAPSDSKMVAEYRLTQGSGSSNSGGSM